MKKLQVGTTVPNFSLASTAGTFALNEQRGRYVVLYFYPRDNTPGCTQEGLDFHARKGKFSRAGARIFGISRDRLSAHQRFKEKQGFGFDLLADPDEKICALFDVMKTKTMFGATVRGIQRSTFLIDKEGVLRHEWRKVKVLGHADEVLQTLKALGSSSS